jgi:hypothetical protein
MKTLSTTYLGPSTNGHAYYSGHNSYNTTKILLRKPKTLNPVYYEVMGRVKILLSRKRGRNFIRTIGESEKSWDK